MDNLEMRNINELTMEELEALLNSNEPVDNVVLDSGALAGYQDIQGRYNALKNASNTQTPQMRNINELTMEELEALLNSNEPVDNVVLDSGALAGYQDIQGRYNELKNASNTQTQPTQSQPVKSEVDIDEMSLDELLNLYAKNEAEIRRINEISSISPGQNPSIDSDKLKKLSEMQKKIEEKISEQLNLMDEFKNLSDNELDDLKAQSKEKLSELWRVVTASGSQASEEEQKAKEKLEGIIKAIDGEKLFRSKQEQLKEQMRDVLGVSDIEGVEKKDPNDISYQLDDNDKDKFIAAKDKYDLLNKISNNRKKENNNNLSNVTGQEPTPEQNQMPDQTFTVSFMNCGIAIDGYFDLKVPANKVIHGPVIDPVPLNKKGQPKKITAKVFSGWMDQDGNDVDLSQPLNRNVILTAKYKFDAKKAIAVGAGAAVGVVAFTIDSTIPVPVISPLGTVGFGVASNLHGKNLKNVQAQVATQASEITAFDEIPEDLQEKINKTKKRSYIQTFLKTARNACIVSSAVRGIKNIADGLHNASANTIGDHIDTPVDTSTITNPDITPMQPASNINLPQPENVFGGYEPTGQVFRTAQDALTSANGLNPYTPAFTGNETFEVLYNGMRVPIEKGQTIESILQSVGATDPSQVAVNVMNADGVPLTWQSLSDLVVEGVEKGSSMIH